LAGVAIIAGCGDSTGPKSVEHTNPIMQIRVPAHATFSDTLKISFGYSIPCSDTGAVIRASGIAGGWRITVTSWTSDPRFCPLTDIIAPNVGYLVNPPHPVPLRFVFTEPSGGDSVRVVEP
jgi:hypothetical protein